MGESVKLTKAQREALALISDGRVTNRKFGYGAWRIQGASPTVVGRVISLKLAGWVRLEDGLQGCALTPSGLQALKDADHGG